MKGFGIGFGLLILVIGCFSLSSCYTIDAGERGVYLRNGAVVSQVDPGLGWKLPFFDSISRVSTRTQIVKLDGDEAYSFDQQPANITMSVNYSVDPTKVTRIYQEFGSIENLQASYVVPRIRQQFKNVFGTMTGQVAIQQRDKLNADALKALTVAIGDMVTVEGVQVEDVKFDPQYVASIMARMKAEVAVQTANQNALEAQATAKGSVFTAQGQADSQLAVAKAKAEATRIQGEAEAEAIHARGDALKDNPALVALTQAERWNGVLPTTMVPGASVPMLSVK